MGHSNVRAKACRRKVAAIAAHNRIFTVSNNTIPEVDKSNLIEKEVKWGKIISVKGVAEWNIPKEGYKQPRQLRKKYKKKYYCKGSNTIRKIVSHPSDYDQFPDRTFHPNKGRAWYMEQVVQHKIAKWERKNPCPIKEEGSNDMFEEEFVVPWKAQRNIAIERIRDFVVSIYDKLPLIGRFETGNKGSEVYTEEKIAELKDSNGDGHKVNSLNPDKSKLLKKAQKKTNEVHAKRTNLICTNLRDHRRQHGRIILPQAA